MVGLSLSSLGLGLSPQVSGGSGGTPAPSGANRLINIFGDSRADNRISGTPPSAGVAGSYFYDGYVSFLQALCPRIRINTNGDYGIGGQTTTQMNTVPRTGTATKGKDYLAADTPANVIMIAGTNDSAGLATSQGAVNGILATIAAKTVFLMNELPRGINDAGAVQSAHGTPAVFKQYQDWLETLDYRVPTTGLANVVSVNTWDDLVEPLDVTNYYNLQGVNPDGLHPSLETGYHIAKLLRDAIEASYDSSVDYITPYLPTAVDPANPTAGEIASYASRNPFLTGTTGTFFGWTGTTTGTVPTGMFIVGGGNATGLTVDVTYGTDADGYRQMRIHVYGTTSAGGSGSIQLYENIGATHLLTRGIAPGDTLGVVGMLAIDGMNGSLAFMTGNTGQVASGYYTGGYCGLGLRHGIYGAGLLDAADYYIPLPYRTPDFVTPAGGTWTAGNSTGAPQVSINVSTNGLGSTAVDFTIYASRLTLVKL